MRLAHLLNVFSAVMFVVLIGIVSFRLLFPAERFACVWWGENIELVQLPLADDAP